MKINIKIVGTLLKPFGKSEFQYECGEGITLRELLLELKYNERHLSHIMTAANGQKENHSFTLSDNDSVVLSTVIGGG